MTKPTTTELYAESFGLDLADEATKPTVEQVACWQLGRFRGMALSQAAAELKQLKPEQVAAIAEATDTPAFVEACQPIDLNVLKRARERIEGKVKAGQKKAAEKRKAAADLRAKEAAAKAKPPAAGAAG